MAGKISILLAIIDDGRLVSAEMVEFARTTTLDGQRYWLIPITARVAGHAIIPPLDGVKERPQPHPKPRLPLAKYGRLRDEVAALLQTASAPIPADQIKHALGYDQYANAPVGPALTQLQKHGVIVKSTDGWVAVPPAERIVEETG